MPIGDVGVFTCAGADEVHGVGASGIVPGEGVVRVCVVESELRRLGSEGVCDLRGV